MLPPHPPMPMCLSPSHGDAHHLREYKPATLCIAGWPLTTLLGLWLAAEL